MSEPTRWYRLCNPLATRKPPAPGSLPETVLSVPPLELLLINDDWHQTIARAGVLALSTTDGVRRVTIQLDTTRDPRASGDCVVFLAHPNRLFIRTADGLPPTLGEWLPDAPDRELAHAEQRVGQKIRKGRR